MKFSLSSLVIASVCFVAVLGLPQDNGGSGSAFPGCNLRPDERQLKTSALDRGFAPFDNAPVGPGIDSVTSCSSDSECASACCDGKKCRAPDAIKQGVQTCRNGLTPSFNDLPPGQCVKFVQMAVSDPKLGGGA